MNERTTRETVTFLHPWRLPGVDRALPAGAYEVETDEEPIPGLSFLAYRRVRTTILLPLGAGSYAGRQVTEIDPVDLAHAQTEDASDPRGRSPPLAI